MKWKPENGMNEAFWLEWNKDNDLLRRCDMLQRLDRLSYDHAVNWIEATANFTRKQAMDEPVRLLHQCRASLPLDSPILS